MRRASGWAKGLAFVLLVSVAFGAAHLTARMKIADEHVAATRAVAQVPFSGAVGEAVTCAYGRLWNVKCAAADSMPALKNLQAMNLPELQQLNLPDLSIRYLCAADPVHQSMECSDRNMVGVAAILTILAGLLAVGAALSDARVLPDRKAAMSALIRYGVCAAASVLMLWQLSRLTLTTIWIASLDERITATRPVLAFTGNVIGYGILIALASVAILGAGASAAALARR